MSRLPARLDGQVAIVTGGGGGIGRAIVAALSAVGARVLIADLDAEAAKDVADAARSEGAEAFGVGCDITSPSSVDDMVSDTERRWGRLDKLVNNADAIHVDPLLTVAIETWERVFAVNVTGPLLLTQRVAPVMIAQSPDVQTGCRGKIVNVSSTAALRGRPFLPAYGASKAALNHLSKTTSLVLAEHDIATTVFYPGSILAGMMGSVGKALAAAEGRSEKDMQEERIAGTPVGRFQTADEAAAMVHYIVAFRGMGLSGKVLHSQAYYEEL
jgi:NAD(P)-dependent dehydrogenase (short-subunit alcohol dehydrogenase family)